MALIMTSSGDVQQNDKSKGCMSFDTSMYVIVKIPLGKGILK
jgi:hypothetical protein